MSLVFFILAAMILASALAAMFLRNLVHCALSLVVTFIGLAALYLQLQAEFVGFVQLLVYVGAVAILIVFAILLTRSSETDPGAQVLSSSWWAGAAVAMALVLVLGGAILGSALQGTLTAHLPTLMVKRIGLLLLDTYLLPLEVIGLLLTAAMVGAVLIAMHEKRPQAVTQAPP